MNRSQGIKITFDPLNHVFTFTANVNHGTQEEFHRDRTGPEKALVDQKRRLEGKVVAISRSKRIRILSVEWDTKNYYDTFVTEAGRTRIGDKTKAVATLIAWAVEYPKHDSMYDPTFSRVVDVSDDAVKGYEPVDITDDMICNLVDDEEDMVTTFQRKRIKVAKKMKEGKLNLVPTLEDHELLKRFTRDEIFVASSLRNPHGTPLIVYDCLEHYSLDFVNKVMVHTFCLWSSPGAKSKETMLALIEELFE
jgi:hypothetical protein